MFYRVYRNRSPTIKRVLKWRTRSLRLLLIDWSAALPTLPLDRGTIDAGLLGVQHAGDQQQPEKEQDFNDAMTHWA